MPNKENIRKWVDALRSGEFRQTTGCLNTGENNRCCLGVACDVYMRETGRGEWLDDIPDEVLLDQQPPEDAVVFMDAMVFMDALVMPKSVADWLGVDINPMVQNRDGLDQAVAVLNDNGATFSELAQRIEDRYIATPYITDKGE